MTITQIIEQTEVESSVKLKEIAEVVSKARKKYGNEDFESESPMVATTEGYVRMSGLSSNDRLALAEKAILNIKTAALEAFEQNPAIVVNKEIEKAIATNDVLINLTKVIENDYI